MDGAGQARATFRDLGGTPPPSAGGN